MPEKCEKCDGCRRVADTEDQEPWTAWLDMPLKSSLAVLSGIIKPITCPRCDGSGEVIVEPSLPEVALPSIQALADNLEAAIDIIGTKADGTVVTFRRVYPSDDSIG